MRSFIKDAIHYIDRSNMEMSRNDVPRRDNRMVRGDKKRVQASRMKKLNGEKAREGLHELKVDTG